MAGWVRGNTEREGAYETSYGYRQHKAAAKSEQCRNQAVLQYENHQLGVPGTKRKPQSKFAFTLFHSVGDDAINFDEGQYQGS